ncbi:putative purine nucleoside permease [Rosellinia necatrix]|uniref:Putative purine nucleoside permease n=1 Tax=Rosellinia necatrix TaxID=77044 RepID=A0A1W2TMB2_ROSNE|nr:putative purine nucleoside permease [Rosellinia necatrix]
MMQFVKQLPGYDSHAVNTKIAPQIFILAMFHKEAENWLSGDSEFNFSRSVPLPGLSRGYGDVKVTEDGRVCLLILGTALINAALSIAALVSSGEFDLVKTYFLISGIAGVNPRQATIGSVAFAKFVVQVDTQQEFDARQISPSWSTGYVPSGAASPATFPLLLHGSEVFELNEELRRRAMLLTSGVSLVDSERSQEIRALFAGSLDDKYHPATLRPSIIKGDTLSANTFWHGNLLSDAMGNTSSAYTNGKAQYVVTAQEDSAVLAAMLRAALQHQVDFSRIIVTRSGSNFDRGCHDNEPIPVPLTLDPQVAADALRNLYLAGTKIVHGILEGWAETFHDGIPAQNYIGDVFGSLGGKPDFLVEGGKS